MTGNQAIIVSILALIFATFYLAFIRPNLGYQGLELPENMTQTEKAKLNEEMKSMVLCMVLISVIIAVSAALGSYIYRGCHN